MTNSPLFTLIQVALHTFCTKLLRISILVAVGVIGKKIVLS